MPGCGNSRVLDAVNSKLEDRQSSHSLKNFGFIHIMTSLTCDTDIGGANRRIVRVGNISGLASSQVREAGSGHTGESCKHQKNV